MAKNDKIETNEVLENEKIDLENMNLMERVLRVANEIRIIKNGKNEYSNYKYFKPEEINQKVNPLLLKYKIFPLFYSYYETYDMEICETMESEKAMKCITKKELKEIAKLEFQDILGKDKTIVYQMPIERIDIKGANKMQNIGGVRTYAKRYLYMEALNISDDKLDLDSDDMSGKNGKLKPSSNDTKVAEIKGKIQLKIETLREEHIKDVDIVKVIKEVYSDGGKPSANYANCKSVEDAQRILDALNKAF